MFPRAVRLLPLEAKASSSKKARVSRSSRASRSTSSLAIQGDRNIRRRSSPVDQTIFRWDDLPVEIREQIFDEVGKQQGAYGPGNGYFCYRGEMPELVIALRSLPKSHAHILQWFAKMNTSILLKPRYPSPGRADTELNKEELAIIGRAVIELRSIAFPIFETPRVDDFK